MFKHMLAAAVAAALMTAAAAPALAQAQSEASDKAAAKPAKKLTPQQQKMKDCGARWRAHKKEKNVKGQAEYRKFLSACLKG